MRVIVHDYGGYAFPVQLSRELARRGHDVLHLYGAHIEAKGRLWKEGIDPPTFNINGVDAGRKYEKYSLSKRWRFERAYGRALSSIVKDYKPDVLFNANCPLETANLLVQACNANGVNYVHWMQDIHASAIRAILPKKIPVIGSLIAEHYTRTERHIVEKAAATIFIARQFLEEIERLNMHPKKYYVVPNWMPLDEMKPEAKVNSWSIKHGLDQTKNIIYVGTLSFKHDGDIFVGLAKTFSMRPEVRVVAVGGGEVMNRLQQSKAEQNLDNLVLLGWQAYADIARIIATGDVLLAAVTPDASQFSVPCKVLTYLSAGRAVLAAIPPNNLVADILNEGELGLVVDPRNIDDLVKAADRLMVDDALRIKLCERGRSYAIRNFDIDRIGDRFEGIIIDVSGARVCASSHVETPQLDTKAI